MYIQLLEAQSEVKKKDMIIDQTETEFTQLREAQEAYRDQIDFLQNELDELKSG